MSASLNMPVPPAGYSGAPITGIEAAHNRRLTPRLALAHHYAGGVWPFVFGFGLCGDWCRLAQCRRERSRLTRCCSLVGSSTSRNDLCLNFISAWTGIRPPLAFAFLQHVIPAGLVRLRPRGLGECQRGLPDDLKPPVIAALNTVVDRPRDALGD